MSAAATRRKGRRPLTAMRVTPGAWGLVTILGGTHKGRIGLYDDDDENGRRGIIYFGDMDYVRYCFYVPHQFLGAITTADLMRRREAINAAIGFAAKRVADDQRADLLAELLLIDGALADRLLRSRLTEPEAARRVFISYSSKDKQFATWLAVDLANAGHSIWLDEWRIRVGESIPTRVAEGVEQCDALVVVLSDHAVKSHWVENEWQAKYMAELKDGKVRVLPALLQACEIPILLRPKKYADFTYEWSEGLEELLVALRD